MFDHLPESSSLASILAEPQCTTREGLRSQNDWLHLLNTNPITMTEFAEPCGRAALLGFPHPPALHACAFPNKLSLCQHSCPPRTIHFRVGREPSFRALEEAPFLQQYPLMWNSSTVFFRMVTC